MDTLLQIRGTDFIDAVKYSNIQDEILASNSNRGDQMHHLGDQMHSFAAKVLPYSKRAIFQK